MSRRHSRQRPGASAERRVDAELAALRRSLVAVEPRPALLDAVRRAVRSTPRRARRPQFVRAALALAASLLVALGMGGVGAIAPTTHDAGPSVMSVPASVPPLVPARGPAANPAAGAVADDDADARFLALLASASSDDAPASLEAWTAALLDPDPDVRALARILLADNTSSTATSPSDGDDDDSRPP